MIIKRHLGLTCQAHPWRTRSGLQVSQNTAASSPGRQQRGKTLCRYEWCVVSWAPPLSPTFPSHPDLTPVLPPGPGIDIYMSQIYIFDIIKRYIFDPSVTPPFTESQILILISPTSFLMTCPHGLSASLPSTPFPYAHPAPSTLVLAALPTHTRHITSTAFAQSLLSQKISLTLERKSTASFLHIPLYLQETYDLL